MADLLLQLFALVCSQIPERSWAPGGVLLPFDQRCTGLYVGAAMAVGLHLLLRFRPGIPLLCLQAVMLLQMVPLGFHLIPHGPVARTLSGLLFSYGVVGYLWLLPGTASFLEAKPGAWRTRAYLLGAGATLVVVPSAAIWGGPIAAVALSWLGLAGLLALATLVIVDFALCVLSIGTGIRCLGMRVTS